mmetsp:Transcript_33382/g.58584  ORF Transcript_33382/g.58584 Transcript_33382/m.58584 type:complete len:733 (+) Transcript_33382:458-2656(+)|eukprot:CAMPEP_0201878762 /NCGR_PEP_ID=MMETSP0902-20130614/9836_1 /ASSEMBLY_ACC=CAM_ASM_000551 /TAXON_ID=420261 /ORGANISM="Thalassiosira antarctica, Strain CCMP982" /LENGTH=732 /DNA_ID=CAMNT_0048406453 /DNA_START=346 /DNA_END=2544 /DNA_ORIENTATION=+
MADLYPKRVIWMQEEETLKWILVGLSAEGEVQDPSDYEDVHTPLPDQPSGRVWMRDENTGKWVFGISAVRRASQSQEELAQADAPVRRASSSSSARDGGRPPRGAPRRLGQSNKRQGASSSLSSIHHKYAMRLSGGQMDVTEEEDQDYDLEDDGEEDGVTYHMVRPSDTFQFICLKYKVSADALRGVNNFSGSTLQFAPKKLVIPSKEDQKKYVKSSPRKQSDSNVVETVNNVHVSYAPIRKKPSVEFGSSSNLKMKDREEDEVKYHWIEPDDSLRWICLKYKVNANDLRRANNFTGSNLKLAPKKLIIPKTSLSSCLKKAPRLRRPKSNGSNASTGSNAERRSVVGNDTASCPVTTRAGREDESLSSSFFSSLTMTEREDSNSSMGNLHSMASQKGLIVPEGISEWETFEGTDMNPLDFSHITNGYSESPYGNEETEFIAPAPMEMVHLQGAQKVSIMGGCDSDSDIEDEPEEETPAGIGNGHTNGVRYHNVRFSDTIEYLCMKYRVSAPGLRRANIGLTGRNLQTGPKRLIIPSSAVYQPQQINTSYKKKDTNATQETETVTTHDDETNTLALSDGHSTLADQMAALEILHIGEEDKALYHDVGPNDTLQGVCLLYGISAYELRRANNFRGLNLSCAPERLVIPKNERNQSKGFKTLTEDEMIQSLMAHVPISRQTKKPVLSHDKARAYLEFNDWNFDQALRNVKVDVEWTSQKSRIPTKSASYRSYNNM